MATRARALALIPRQPALAPPVLTPEVLIGRVALGDDHAFAALYDLLAGVVLGMVTRVLRDRAQSEEVAQEVLLEVWRKAASFSEHRGSVRAWVLTIAHRRAIDRVRAEQAGSDRETRAGLLDPRRSVPSPALALSAHGNRRIYPLAQCRWADGYSRHGDGVVARPAAP